VKTVSISIRPFSARGGDVSAILDANRTQRSKIFLRGSMVPHRTIVTSSFRNFPVATGLLQLS
jgi:hypothetical protein